MRTHGPQTPRPWPTLTIPPVDQLAEWLRVCTVGEREGYVRAAQADALVATDCFVANHGGRLAEYERIVARQAAQITHLEGATRDLLRKGHDV